MFYRSRLTRTNVIPALLLVIASIPCILLAHPVNAQAPPPPTGLSVKKDCSHGPFGWDLSWNASPGATSYNVLWSTASDGPYTAASGISATSYTKTGLNNSNPFYYFKVQAVNIAGASSASSLVKMDAPDTSNTNPISATVTVNWSAPAGTTTSALFGTNDLQTCFPMGGVNDAAYAKALRQIGINFYRLHDSGISYYWTNKATKTWDAAKIAAEYKAPYLQGATLIQTISSPPPWMPQDGSVDPDAYAAFCAQFVGIVKALPGQHALYWEPMNEWNGFIESRSKVMTTAQLCKVYNACATQMKAQDPSIKMAGPVLSWCNKAIIGPFLQGCGANVDLVSWHNYGNCCAHDSTDSAMNSTIAWGKDAIAVRGMINRYCPNPSSVKMALDEYNIPCDWQEGETRQWTNIGAAFDASVLKNLAYAGCDIATNWGSKDGGTYGMIDGKDKLIPAGYMHLWANHYLVGKLASTTSTSSMVEEMAVTRADHSRTILVINKASGTATVMLSPDPGTWAANSVNVGSIDSTGVHALIPTKISTLAGHPLVMPPCSVTIFRIAAHAPNH